MSDNAIVTIEGAAIALRTFGMSEHANLVVGLGKAAARVAELEAAVLAEREACAQIAAERGIGHNAGPYAAGCIECAEEIAAAIRARPAP